MGAGSATEAGSRGAHKADRLVRTLFDSVAEAPVPDHLVDLAHELDARPARTRAA